MRHLILGNGPAGVLAAETLRKLDPRADITLIGSEPEPPYSRMAIPYLLAGNIQEPGTYLRKDQAHFDKLKIHLGVAKAQSIDLAKKVVQTDIGASLPYDKLLIATGSHPVSPPIAGMDLPGIYTCWTMADARKIIANTKPGSRVLQMGAGFIGCIIMEALALRGVKLTVVEMGDRMVPRMMTATAGAMIKTWVEKKGVSVHTSARVDAITKGADSPLMAKLSNGQSIAADVIISATGVRPNIEFLKNSGIATKEGVLVDQYLRTNQADVYAIGDVTEAIGFHSGEPQLNAVQPNAADQARIAAANMAGHVTAYQGSLAINVLDTLGLISTSFGQWWGTDASNGGSSVEQVDQARFKYLSLQFQHDVLIGATSIGWTEHAGALRGLIQTRAKLGKWKEVLLNDPTQFVAAYMSAGQAASVA